MAGACAMLVIASSLGMFQIITRFVLERQVAEHERKNREMYKAGMEILELQPGQRTTLPAISGSILSCISQVGHLNFTMRSQ